MITTSAKDAATHALTAWDGTLPVDVDFVATSFGVRIVSLETTSEVSAAAVYEDGEPVIFLSKSLIKGTPEYAVELAYALGHLSWADATTIGAPKRDYGYLSEKEKPYTHEPVSEEDEFARDFANYLLVPDAPLRTMLMEYDTEEWSNVFRIAEHFGVPPDIMLQRIQHPEEG